MTDVVPSATEYEPEPIEEDADADQESQERKTDAPPEKAGDPAI